MDFVAKADIEAPVVWVFQRVTDFTAFERQAMRRGADVRRADALPRPGLGSIWDVQFRFRGKDRQLRAEIASFEPPNGYDVQMVSPNLQGSMRVELVALSRAKTRLSVEMTVEAKTLPARLLLQSLKLAKGNMNGRFETRVTDFAKELQDRYARRPGAVK